jgi:DNA-binding response OmpR family regulator
MCILLDVFGHEVRSASTGLEALELANEFLPHCVILDIGLPDASGYEVCRELRKRVSQPTYIAAVTGWGTTADRVKALAAGFDAHYLKPITEAVVREILAAAAVASSLPAQDATDDATDATPSPV